MLHVLKFREANMRTLTICACLHVVSLMGGAGMSHDRTRAQEISFIAQSAKSLATHNILVYSDRLAYSSWCSRTQDS